MKRGLKYVNGWPGNLRGVVKEDSPMKRGLKCLQVVNSHIFEPVKEDSPMKRGLKFCNRLYRGSRQRS